MTLSLDPIVVGVSGSEIDDLALDWAVDEARSSNRPLRLVYAYQWPLSSGSGPFFVTGPAYYLGDSVNVRVIADEVMEKVLAQAASLDPSVEITGAAVEGPAVSVLVAESSHASLIVLGAGQSGAFGSVLGSVSAAVAARAQCPAVVLRGPAGLAAEQPAVVVGIDGQDADTAHALLAFGFDYASRHGVALRAVLCWHPDPLVAMQWRRQGAPPDRVLLWLSEALAGWRERYPDVQADAATTSEHPTAGLLAESLNQRLLVIGTRGRHALTGTLLGSVSQGVLHHAQCPVAVVPTHE